MSTAFEIFGRMAAMDLQSNEAVATDLAAFAGKLDQKALETLESEAKAQ